jgi:hypothetical protein
MNVTPEYACENLKAAFDVKVVTPFRRGIAADLLLLFDAKYGILSKTKLLLQLILAIEYR